MNFKFKTSVASAVTFALMASTAFAGTLVINTDTSDPAPKAAFEQLIKDFEAENSDIKLLSEIS